MTEEIVANGKAILGRGVHDILVLRWKDAVDINEDDAHSAIQAIQTLSGGREHPLLVNMTDAGQVSKGARNAFGIPHASKIALVGGNPVDRVVANFFVGVQRPLRPTHFFATEPEALRWLSGD